MNSWETKTLEATQSVLKHLSGIVADYGLFILIGLVFFAMPLCVWILRGGLRRKQLRGTAIPVVQSAVVIPLSEPPPAPQQETFDPFPPFRDTPERDREWKED